MKLDEFKAWFEGFTESMDSTPNEKQWARIRARVKEIDGAAVTERIYFDRYFPAVWPAAPYPAPFAPYRPSWNCAGSSVANVAGTTSFSSTNAMAALGRAEALSN